MAFPYTDRPNNFISTEEGVHAIYQKPVQFVENVFGQAQTAEMRNKNMDFDQLGKYKYESNIRDRGFQGQLPMNTSPRLWSDGTQERMIPENTRVSKVCFNKALDESGPFYLRRWQIWDYAPLLPSIGDVTKDPRFGQQTRSFLTEYKKLL